MSDGNNQQMIVRDVFLALMQKDLGSPQGTNTSQWKSRGVVSKSKIPNLDRTTRQWRRNLYTKIEMWGLLGGVLVTWILDMERQTFWVTTEKLPVRDIRAESRDSHQINGWNGQCELFLIETWFKKSWEGRLMILVISQVQNTQIIRR